MKTDSLILLIAAAAAVVIVASAQRPSAASTSTAPAAGGQSPLFGGAAGTLWEDALTRDLRAVYGEGSFTAQLARRNVQPIDWQMGTFR